MSGLDLELQRSPPAPLDVAFSVAPGEILALVGRSGAGKSSILKAIAGLLPATGHVRVSEEVWQDTGTRLPPHQRRLGLLFQGYALFPHMTALQNVMSAMDRPDPAEAGRLLARVHLEGLDQRRPHQLSGGQQQRTALARTLARRPRLLLLDEPFSATDRPTRRALAQTIRELRADLPIPIILVSHDIEDVSQLADRIAVLDHGRIIQIGPTRDVMANPANALVRDLVA